MLISSIQCSYHSKEIQYDITQQDGIVYTLKPDCSHLHGASTPSVLWTLAKSSLFFSIKWADCTPHRAAVLSSRQINEIVKSIGPALDRVVRILPDTY